MALSSSTFSSAGDAVDSLFAGFGELAGGKLKGKALNLQAQGLRIKAQGNLAEATNYDLAGDLAKKNVAFTEQSFAIKQMQMDREISKSLGETRAGVAGAGFANSGSALDILRDSAAQGALSKAVLGQQGLITEAGYQQQADSFKVMAGAARMAAEGEFSIADQTDQLAKDTVSASETAAFGKFVSSGFKAATSIATLGLF